MDNETAWTKEIGENLIIIAQKITSVEKSLVIMLTGRIDAYNSQSFRETIQSEIISVKNIIFDFSGIHNISSTGIGAFVTFYKIIKNNSGNIVFININPSVWNAFDILGFNQLFIIKNKLDEALEFIKKTPEKQEPFLSFILQCSKCHKELKISKSGWFRCPGCKYLFLINENGKIDPSCEQNSNQ